METALNLVWLAVTLGALTAWNYRWSRRVLAASDTVPQYVRLGALCCALVLLFFVISVSDDLQQAAGLIEDTPSRSSSPFKSKLCRTSAHNLGAAPADAARGLGLLLLRPAACFRRIRPAENFIVTTIARLSIEGRAPPKTSL